MFVHFDAARARSYVSHRVEKVIPITLGWIQRNIITAFRIDRARVNKMLVEMVYKLEDVAFHRPRDGDIVNQANHIK